MHKFIKLYSSKKAIKEMQFKTLICDEMRMTPEVLYKFFITLKRVRPELQFIVAGDYNQLWSVCDRIENCNYENSAALYELVNGNRLTLTTCRRSDPPIYNIYAYLTKLNRLKKQILYIIKPALIFVLPIR